MTDKKAKSIKLEIPARFEWCRVFEFNRDQEGYRGKHKAYGGAYTIDTYMSADAYAQLKEAGSQKQGKILDEETGKWEGGSAKELRAADEIKVSFERKHEAPYTYGGPPTVAHADGTYWDTEEDGLIGNNSTGYIMLTVYEIEIDGEPVKGTRFDGLQIIDHVPYESDYEPSSGVSFPDRSGGTKKEVKEKASKPKASKKVEEEFEDVIPF